MASERLAAAEDLMPRRGVLADVGAGDGRLALRLAMRSEVEAVYATEKGGEVLRSLRRTCAHRAKLVVRAGDGLAPLRGLHLDGVAVLGMGGLTILGILREAADHEGATFVLGPMQAAPQLRSGLADLGLEVVDERLARHGGRVYPILAVRHGEARPLSGIDAALGPILRRTRPDGFTQLVRERLAYLHARLEGACGARRAALARDIEDLEAEL